MPLGLGKANHVANALYRRVADDPSMNLPIIPALSLERPAPASELERRATIRTTAMEVCRWDSIPERLWRGEMNSSSDEFRSDHEEYFGSPDDDFKFVA